MNTGNVNTYWCYLHRAKESFFAEEMVEKRGTMFGCGMAVIPLGDGVVGIEAIVKELQKVGFDGYTTLEIAGTENVKTSVERLQQWS